FLTTDSLCSSFCPHPSLHSFPTRRSSDLGLASVRQDASSCPRGRRTGPGPSSPALAPTHSPPAWPTRPERQTSPPRTPAGTAPRSEEHTSELQSLRHLVCRLLLEKKK